MFCTKMKNGGMKRGTDTFSDKAPIMFWAFSTTTQKLSDVDNMIPILQEAEAQEDTT